MFMFFFSKSANNIAPESTKKYSSKKTTSCRIMPQFSKTLTLAEFYGIGFWEVVINAHYLGFGSSGHSRPCSSECQASCLSEHLLTTQAHCHFLSMHVGAAVAQWFLSGHLTLTHIGLLLIILFCKHLLILQHPHACCRTDCWGMPLAAHF